MARRKLVEQEVAKDEVVEKTNDLARLSELVKSWGENKSVMDTYKKPVNADAAEIKELMIKHGIEDSMSGNFTAHLSYKTSEAMDEVELLKYIKSVIWADKGSMECPYIERIEVINWDALEKAIYNGTITKEQAVEMDKFKTITKTPSLTLKIAKED